MKKNYPALLIATAFILLLSSCNNGLTGDAYTLKMRMAKADTFHQNIKMDMKMAMDIKDHPVNMKMNMDAGIRFEVMDSSSTNRELKFTYNSMHMSMDMGNNGLPGINTDSIMNDAAQNVIGKSVLLDLSPSNEIVAVKGFDSLLANGPDGEVKRQMMEKMFSKDQMNSLFGMMFSMYPGKPVKVGETWTAKTKVNVSNIDMQINIKYKLAGIKNGLADIDVDGVLDGTGAMKQGETSVSVSMSGTQKGILTIKMDDGYLKNGNYKMDVKADMQMGGQKIPMTIVADYYLNNN